MNRKLHILLVFCLMAIVPFLSTSCSSKKAMTKTTLREFTARQLIKEVDDNAFDYENMMAKISVKVETNDKNVNMKGQLRMQKDSIIWTSLSLPLGVEVLRIKVSTDSVYFLNRNDKTYLCENIEVFSDISPLITSLPFIQSVLVGNDINLRESDNYKLLIDGDQYNLLISKSLKKSIKQKDDEWKVMLKDIWIDPQHYKITKYHIREYNDSKRKIELQYSDFQQIGEKYIPTKISIDIHGDQHLKADIIYSNIIINDNIDFIFNVPKKYERIYR
ncbi:MAG: DUF4292 domain-containing protein [Bacteroidales bacterium]|nr:DUF4292 domain-containing protein [Bacteroidales bacterium]